MRRTISPINSVVTVSLSAMCIIHQLQQQFVEFTGDTFMMSTRYSQLYCHRLVLPTSDTTLYYNTIIAASVYSLQSCIHENAQVSVQYIRPSRGNACSLTRRLMTLEDLNSGNVAVYFFVPFVVLRIRSSSHVR